ncbi:metallophosphoesterase [Acidithiobacillus sp. M4-SHS-6]|uniref:metallophosphoesterase n=1 Tax=Acidithiobacillus sp. M4-SHS-6 TaxID=3383024 RepID=UPI0039BE9439
MTREQSEEDTRALTGKPQPFLRLLSDIHVDVNPPATVRLASLTTDPDSILVLAGDFGTPKKLADWLKMVAPPFPHIVAVLGNHDYWGFSVERAPEKWREGLARHVPEDLMARFTLLERQSVDIGNIRFFGTTLWSDFDGGDPCVMRAARETMQDHKRIRCHGGARRFAPQDALSMHLASKTWLETAVAEPWDGSKVVITHHAPAWNSLYPSFRKDDLSGAYASHLEESVAHYGDQGVQLWMHGHIHHVVDYRIGKVRVLSNPFGYPREGTGVQLEQVIELEEAVA